jgi:hypothetical protein
MDEHDKRTDYGYRVAALVLIVVVIITSLVAMAFLLFYRKPVGLPFPHPFNVNLRLVVPVLAIAAVGTLSAYLSYRRVSRVHSGEAANYSDDEPF